MERESLLHVPQHAGHLARARRASVLDAMVDDGYVTQQQANAAGTEVVTLPPAPGEC